MGFEAVKRAAPKAAVEIDPICGAREVFGFQTATPMLAVPLALDELGILQKTEMARNRGQRNHEGFGEFANSCLALRQARQDRPAGGVRKRGKRCVERIHLTDMLIN